MINKTRTDYIKLEGNVLRSDVQTDRDIDISFATLDAQTSTITSTAVIHKASAVKLLSHQLVFTDLKQVKYLTHSNQWSRLSNSVSVPAFNNLLIELTHSDLSKSILYTNKPVTCKMDLEGKRFMLHIIHDAPFIHPTWDYSKGMRMSSATPEHNAGTTFKATLTAFRPDKEFNPVYRSYYPNGAKACFILTDHCDFDTTKKLDVFLHGNNNDGWLNKGLKITKGAFRYSPGSDEPRKSDDLEVEAYKPLMDNLRKDGSEICPHALKHSGQLSSEQFHNGLDALHRFYAPQTWIDHGSYLKYCYSQNGHLNPDYRLLDSLKEKGYNNLWSFYDTNLDPSFSLDFFSDRKYNLLNAVKIIILHFCRLNFLYSLHYIRSFIHKNFAKSVVVDFLNYAFACSKELFITLAKNKKHIFKATGYFISRLFKFNSFRTKTVEHFTLQELNDFCPPLFTENHQSINNYSKGLLFFNTIETTHIKDIYTDKLLNKLIGSSGLHIGHTYILNSLPYINGIFTRSKTSIELSKEWIHFTESLSAKIKNGAVWNPNMGEFTERVKQVLNIEVKYAGDELIVTNNNNADVIDFTLFDINNNKFITTLKANHTTTVPAQQFSNRTNNP